MLVNTRLVRIEWGDCDPAGIIYYPRYFAFFDASTSALIERALGMNKRDYLKKYDFDVQHQLTKDGTLAVEGFETRVWVKGDPARGQMKGVPLPQDLIERLSRG